MVDVHVYVILPLHLARKIPARVHYKLVDKFL
jgi:hypothetical protein